jgi:hypothetical protein
MEVLDAAQQLDKAQTSFGLAVGAALQHSIQQLAACQQLGQQVYLRVTSMSSAEGGAGSPRFSTAPGTSPPVNSSVVK